MAQTDKDARKTAAALGALAVANRRLAASGRAAVQPVRALGQAQQQLAAQCSLALPPAERLQAALRGLQITAHAAAVPLRQALHPALTALAEGAATAVWYAGRLIALLTGKSMPKLERTAQSVGRVGKAAGHTARQLRIARGALAEFDELDVLRTEETGGSGSGGSAGSAAELPAVTLPQKIPFLEEFLDALQNSRWYEAGRILGEKLREALNAIPWDALRAQAHTVATRLATLLNGFIETPRLWSSIGRTIAGGLNTALQFVDSFVQTLHWGSLGQGMAEALRRAVQDTDWALLGRVLTDKLRAALLTLHGFVTGGFDWQRLGDSMVLMLHAAFANVDWVQAFGDLSTLATGVLNTLLAVVQGIDWVLLGETVAACLLAVDWNGILLRLQLLLGQLLAGMAAALQTMFHTLAQNCGEGFLQGMLLAFAGLFEWVKQVMVDPLVNAAKTLLGIHSPSTVFAEIGTNVVAGMLQGISRSWGTVTGFLTTALQQARQLVQQGWNAVLAVTNSVWNGICDAVRAAVNGVISAINGMVSAVASGINQMANMLNRLSFTMPKALGGGHVGFHIPTVSAPQIPLLAEGGVIRQPTLAMMGEYTGAARDPEIVTPEHKMTEVFAAQLAPLVQLWGELVQALQQEERREVVIRFAASGGLEQLVRLLKPYIDRENRRTGTILVQGSAF